MDAIEDEAARFLDLAAYADGLLDAEEEERVAALVAADPEAAADVGAARALAGTEGRGAGLERIIVRAAAIPSGADLASGKIVPLAARQRRRLLQHFAQWGSLAAAIGLAGWLGFAMGSDTSLALSVHPQSSDTGLLPELFDPGTSLLGEGLRT